MEIIAHWGVGHAPTLDEHGNVLRMADHIAGSMPALLVATIAGYPIAVDVYEAMDGVAVCWTSEFARRDPDVLITEARSGELERMGVPSLHSVLEQLLHRTKLYLELASFRSGTATVQALRGVDGDFRNRLVVSSHAVSELARVREAYRGIPIAWTRDASQIARPSDIGRTIRDHGISAVHLEPAQCLREIIAVYAEHDCLVRARNIQTGVQAFAHQYEGVTAVFTDNADRVKMDLAA
jgi:hypothetical protein